MILQYMGSFEPGFVLHLHLFKILLEECGVTDSFFLFVAVKLQKEEFIE